MRTVICHYHIYKNSGTSFDSLLSKNYGERHICMDGPFPYFIIDQEQLGRVIERNSKVIAFSSHQFQLPVPVSLDFQVLPVVFVRHPLLRIQSIYKFKRQSNDGTITSANAQNMMFDEWIEHCFIDRQEITHISNAQTRLLGSVYRQRPLMRRNSHAMEYDINQAIRNIENVQLLARTEYFNQDVGYFPRILKKYGVEFNFKETTPLNVTSNFQNRSISDRVDQVTQSLSDGNYQKLLIANKQDSLLFDYVSNSIGNRNAANSE